MSTFTPNINLEMPEPGEKFKLETWNGNLSLIDEAVANSGGTLTYTIAPYDCPEPYKSRADLILTEDGAANSLAINNAIEELNAARESADIQLVIRFLGGTVEGNNAAIDMQYDNVKITGDKTKLNGFRLALTGNSIEIESLCVVTNLSVSIYGANCKMANCEIEGSGWGALTLPDGASSFRSQNNVYASNEGNTVDVVASHCVFVGDTIINEKGVYALFNEGFHNTFIACDVTGKNDMCMQNANWHNKYIGCTFTIDASWPDVVAIAGFGGYSSFADCTIQCKTSESSSFGDISGPYITVHNCHMSGATNRGLGVTGANCTITDNVIDAANEGLYVTAQDTIITGNHMVSGTISVKSGTTKPASAAMLADLNVGTIVLT